MAWAARGGSEPAAQQLRFQASCCGCACVLMRPWALDGGQCAAAGMGVAAAHEAAPCRGLQWQRMSTYEAGAADTAA